MEGIVGRGDEVKDLPWVCSRLERPGSAATVNSRHCDIIHHWPFQCKALFPAVREVVVLSG